MNRISILSLLISGAVFFSCSKSTVPASESPSSHSTAVTVPSPPCIVYKTRADYSKYVPVILSQDKSFITSFPGVLDVVRDGKFTYPTPLADGYLLDNRGIGPDVAFLNITYEQYNRNDEVPLASDLFQRILDKDPVLEMYQCGNRGDYTDPEKELNNLIRSGNLKSCQRLK